MVKLERILQKLFGGTAGSNQMGKFGSLAAGTPEYLNDIVNDVGEIQDLGNFEGGWYSAVMGNNSPAIQDRNSLDFLAFYQIAYLMQNGVPEWNAETDYYIDSMCKVDGVIYVSKTDSNLNNDPVSDYENWKVYRTASELLILQNMSTREWTINTVSLTLFRDVVWAPDKKIFVAVGADKVTQSPDGLKWNDITLGYTYSWSSIAYSESLGRFVAVAGTGADRVMYSSDAITWTNISSADDGAVWRSIVWSPDLSLFVAVGTGASQADTSVMTSPDGITWTLRTCSTYDLSSVVWSKSLGLFVASCTKGLPSAGTGTTGTGICTSPDGVTWTNRTIPTAGYSDPSHVAWSPQMGKFVQINVTEVLTSPDAITWTAHTLPTYLVSTNKIIWSPELELFVASTSGSYQSISTSVDGVNWVPSLSMRTSPAGMNGVTWSPELSIFVAVGNSVAISSK